MLFSSIESLYYFIPIVLAIYFIAPTKLKNLVLLLASLFFYFWGEPVYTILMIFMALSGYVHGLLIEKFRGTKLSKVFLVTSIVVGIGALGFFKYSNFFIDNINNFFNQSMSALAIALPIGISFYTFQILSYTIDLYRGRYPVQKNFIDFFTYVALFPQLIAGPIVRYSDINKELKERKHSFENFAYGVNRFIIGLSKKVLIANVLAEFCNIAKGTEHISVLFMWAYVIAYAIHIYFDFSGYSDMAIGLGRIFGFHFPENFNYPYISKSITEFWRRWHMTLGSWFRDYVYIPLGGNRVSKIKWIRNIFVVWFLTGFWHGAGWNFIVWGLMFAVLLLFEKVFFLGEKSVYGRIKSKRYNNKEKSMSDTEKDESVELNVANKEAVVSNAENIDKKEDGTANTSRKGNVILNAIKSIPIRIYVLFFLLISWIIFDASSLTEATGRITMLFGIGENGSQIELVNDDTLYYIRSYAGVFILGIIGCTPLLKNIILKIKEKEIGKRIINILEPVAQVALLVLCTAYLIDGSFNPFLYFRF